MLTLLWICLKQLFASLQHFLLSLLQVQLHGFFCIFKIQAAIKACSPAHPTLQTEGRSSRNQKWGREIGSATQVSGDGHWSQSPFPHSFATQREREKEDQDDSRALQLLFYVLTGPLWRHQSFSENHDCHRIHGSSVSPGSGFRLTSLPQSRLTSAVSPSCSGCVSDLHRCDKNWDWTCFWHSIGISLIDWLPGEVLSIKPGCKMHQVKNN